MLKEKMKDQMLRTVRTKNMVPKPCQEKLIAK